MPTGYRIELSPNARAVCKNKECKDAAVKIQKGELRFASLFTVQDHTSWAYKHWGCVTPEQIKNVQGFIEGDMNLVDGYDELTPEAQAKVDFAIKNGHVPDEDWRGDVELNRPGQKGFRVKASKKRAANDDVGNGGEDSPQPKKKRGRAAKKDDDEAEASAPNKRARVAKDEHQKKPRSKKAAVKDESGNDEPAPAPKKARGKKAAAVKKESSEVEAEPEEKKPSAKAKPVADKAPRPARSNARKASTKASYAQEPTDDETASEDEAPKPKPAKKKASGANKDQKPAPQKRGRRPKAVVNDE